MIKRLSIVTAVILLLCLTASAYGNIANWINTGYRSCMPGDMVSFGGWAYNNTEESIYVNSWAVETPGGLDWYSNYGISFLDPSGSWYAKFTYGSQYAPGESSGVESFFDILTSVGMDDGSGNMVGRTPAGRYTADLVLKGGATTEASDEVGRLQFNLEVVDQYEGFSVSLADPDRTAKVGDELVFAQSYTNTGSRTMYITTVWFGWSDVTFDTAHIKQDFIYGWPGSVDAGTTAQGDVIKLTIHPGALEQTNTAGSGCFGGYYEGDVHEFPTNDLHVQVQPVPEPSSLAGCVFGVVGLLGILHKRR